MAVINGGIKKMQTGHSCRCFVRNCQRFSTGQVWFKRRVIKGNLCSRFKLVCKYTLSKTNASKNIKSGVSLSSKEQPELKLIISG